MNTHLYCVTVGYTPVADLQQQPPLLTWNGLVVGQIKHDDKHARPGNDESQDQDPGQRGAEGGVEVVGERLLWPSRGRRHRLATLAVDDHGGGRWPSWREEKRWSDAPCLHYGLLWKHLRLKGSLMSPPTLQQLFYSLWLCFSLDPKI